MIFEEPFERASTAFSWDNFGNRVPEFNPCFFYEFLGQVGLNIGGSKLPGCSSWVLVGFSIFMEKIIKYFW